MVKNQQALLQDDTSSSSSRLISFPHPMCLGRENDRAYLIPCAAASIDNSSYRNTELVAVQAVMSTMTKAGKTGRLGVETVELDSIDMN